MNETSGAYVVSWDFNHGEDKDLMIVGKRQDGKLIIFNSFQGKEARDIYEKLSTVKEVSVSE